MWLFATVIFNSTYTASLASILSAQGSYPAIAGFQALSSDTNISVGCQESSFMVSYMKKLDLMNHVIKKFTSAEQYIIALNEGDPKGVGAVLVEAPYSQELLQSDCDLTKSSRKDDNLPSFGGFGFAFRQGDTLIDEVSMIILRMAENGTLKDLQDTWQVGDDTGDQCGSDAGPSKLGVMSFGGLFAISSGVYVACTIWRYSTTAIKLSSSKWQKAAIHTLPRHRTKSFMERQAGYKSLSMCANRSRGSDDSQENQPILAAADAQPPSPDTSTLN